MQGTHDHILVSLKCYMLKNSVTQSPGNILEDGKERL